MFEVIHCTPRSDRYFQAFLRKLDFLIEVDRSLKETQLMSIAFLGVKAISTQRRKDDRKNIEALKLWFGKLELIQRHQII